MQNAFSKLLIWLIAAAPLLGAMYGLYWLEASGTWVPETPHRDKVTIAVLAAAMAATYVIRSWFFKRGKR
ncbi:MAG: hypothetical protein AAF607_07490 [Pseudomonadota bacterium]